MLFLTLAKKFSYSKKSNDFKQLTQSHDYNDHSSIENLTVCCSNDKNQQRSTSSLR